MQSCANELDALLARLEAAASARGIALRRDRFGFTSPQAGGLCVLRGVATIVLDAGASLPEQIFALASALDAAAAPLALVATAGAEPRTTRSRRAQRVPARLPLKPLARPLARAIRREPSDF